MVGCAADADDLLQQTFVRLLETAPANDGRPLKPWLVRVALNLARDLLRRRRRTPYVGPWLPSPVASAYGQDGEGVEAFEISIQGFTTEGRYDLLESMTMAFLVALEALTPQQRAVLLLRDVFDYSVRETGAALGSTPAAVKAAHARARRCMEEYEGSRAPSLAVAGDKARQALWDFAEALATGDLSRVEGMLAADARAFSDGGGEFYAALNPIEGALNVARFYTGIMAKFGAPGRVAILDLAGRAALLVERPEADLVGISPRMAARVAPRFVLQVDLDRDGRIARLYSVLATRKLTHVG
jgi:RNA polymerase sigma-70 factor (ECF subfamily)